MTTPVRHNWLKYHLSTLVILMFTAAIILWANLNGRRANTDFDGVIITYGWPSDVYRFVPEADLTVRNEKGEPVMAMNGEIMHWSREPSQWFTGAITDGISAIAILSVIFFLCEWWIRARESILKKPQFRQDEEKMPSV